MFTKAELSYLQDEDRLARLATVSANGMPHVTPVGMWRLDPDAGTVTIRGMNFAATKKFRDVAKTGRAAIVVDDVLPPWKPRGIELRGRAEAVDGDDPHIRIDIARIIAWGLDSDEIGVQNARDVGTAA